MKKNFALPVNVSDGFQQLCKEMDFDSKLSDYKDNLIDWEKLNNMFVLRNQFFYINDFTKANNIYVHPNAFAITGFSSEEFLDFDRIYELIHPDDKEFVFEFSRRSINFCKLYKKELLENPFQSLFTIDFRLKHKDGRYLKINRQTTCLKTDKEGNMVYALVIFTDVTNSKKGDSYNISWIGDTKYLFYFDDLLKKYKKGYKFTSRELKVLELLAEGDSATQIAKKLCLSVHTVISHRKHLLEKTGARNTVELVKIAIEKGFI
ncbi:MAG TPA: LuxR C-terminal-related transcriptional regulator [Tenuifilaceae bacterium]|nr:LuxR C-terminal-related transcriptional regulator [Tenuifilaceae bacterium]